MRALLLAAIALIACGAPPPVTSTPPPAAARAPASAAAPPPAAPAIESVRLAHVPSTLFAPLYVALEKGYLAEQAIDLQLEQITAGQDAMALAAQGHLDAVVGGFAASTFNAVDRGLDLRVVGSMGAQPRSGYPSALMVRDDLLAGGQVQSLADLRGRKVALAGGPGSTGSYWMATKIREANLSLRDLDVVNMAFADMVAAFKTDAIDAALPAAPFTTEILRDQTANLFGGPFRPGASGVGTVYGTAFRRDRDAAAKRLFVGLVRAARDLQGDRVLADEHLEIFSRYTRVPVDVLRAIDPYGYDPDLKPDTDTLMDMQRVFFDAGILVYNPFLTPDQLVDDSYSRAAVSQLGPYRP